MPGGVGRHKAQGRRDKRGITRPSALAPPAPVTGLTLSFVQNGFIFSSFPLLCLADMIFGGLRDNLLGLYIRAAVILRRSAADARCILNSRPQDSER